MKKTFSLFRKSEAKLNINTVKANGPFFIFYDSRSGSTMLARLMAEHLGAVIPPEANFLPGVLKRTLGLSTISRQRKFLRLLEQDDKFADWGVDVSELSIELKRSRSYSHRAMLDVLTDHVMSQNGIEPELRRFGFKKGNYQYHDRAIRQVYPEAFFICLVRDGRAVFNSKIKTAYSRTGKPMAHSPEEAAGEWMRCLDNFERLRARKPERVMILRYEDLVLDTAAMLRRVGDMLGIGLLSGNKSGLDYRVPGRYGTSMHQNIHQAPDASVIDRWRGELSTDAQRRYEALAAAHLMRYGYLADDATLKERPLNVAVA